MIQIHIVIANGFDGSRIYKCGGQELVSPLIPYVNADRVDTEGHHVTCEACKAAHAEENAS